MTAHQLIEALTTLHGSPFSDLSKLSAELLFTSQARQPLAPEPLSSQPVLHRTSEVAALISKALNIFELGSEVFVARDGSWRTFHDQIDTSEAIDKKYSDLLEETKVLSPQETEVFERDLLTTLLGKMATYLDKMPSIADFYQTSDLGQFVRETQALCEMSVRAIRMMHSYVGFSQSESSTARRITENLEHDILGHITYAQTALSDWSEDAELVRKPDMEHLLGRCIPFSSLVAKATLALSNSSLTLLPGNIQEGIALSATILAERFHYGLQINDQVIRDSGLIGNKAGSITVRTFDTQDILVHTESVSLVIYNVIKNSIKHGASKSPSTPLDITIEIAPSSDHGCISVLLRDNGIGISYDLLHDYFSDRAIEKRKNNILLLPIEEFLLNEHWAQHVPPVGLNTLLLDRGASLGNGTGIGLALAQEIIMDKHQGSFSVYRHPEGGACVQILLPNTRSDLPVADRRKITLQSLIHQMEQNLPSVFFSHS